MIQLTILIMTFTMFLILGMAQAGQEKKEVGFSDGLEKATFAGGCFWCMEPPFDRLEGVISTTSGYTGGDEYEPSYEKVSAGKTGHLEAVQIVYDPKKISYGKLLEVFWKNIDPTQAGGQFADIGRQYRTAIFFHNEDQRRLALESRDNLDKSGKFNKSIVTEILRAKDFYPAEEYHQDYYLKNPVRYKYYRFGSGRDRFLNKTWDDD
ncbi:MAG: peptide-methionine (S)-S-oxide reductase MsrA [Desulfobacterales bacterium]